MRKLRERNRLLALDAAYNLNGLQTATKYGINHQRAGVIKAAMLAEFGCADKPWQLAPRMLAADLAPKACLRLYDAPSDSEGAQLAEAGFEAVKASYTAAVMTRINELLKAGNR